tara:strand:+ start:13078 stop:21522 length:8445 start_codon:yes stop_codon:yes gene_type:complete
MPNWTYEDKDGTRLTFESELQPSPDIVPELFENYYDSQRDIGGYVSETLAAVPRGFANSFLSMGEGLVELADAGTNLIGLDELIEDENEVVNTIREGKRYLDEEFGADVAYRDTWANKFGEGVGSFASFFTPIGIGRGLGLAGKGLTALGAGAGAAAGAGEQSARVDAARASGLDVSQGQEDLSVFFGGAIGTSEAFVPINRLLKFIPKSAYSDSVRKRMVSRVNEALVTGGLEGGQEVLAAISQDWVERGVYNKNLAENDSLFDDFTVGGAIGTIADLALRRRQQGITESERDHEAELREKEEQAMALEKELVDNLKTERAAAVKDVTEDLGFPLPDAPPDIPEVDPSTIGFPSPEQIGRRMATPRDYVTVQFPDGSIVQGQEKTIKRNKNTTTTQVEYVDQSNEKNIKTIATNGVPNEGFSVLERKPQETIVSSALRNKKLAGDKTTAASTKKAGDTYAHHIRATMGLKFPTHITFKAEQVQSPDPQNPQFAVVGSDGVQYGTSFDTINEAFQLASSLNGQAIDQQIDLNAISRIEATQESYDDPTKSILKRYNRRIVHPEENLIPYYAVNEAAGTITEKGFDETATFDEQIDKARRLGYNKAQLENILTASQKINRDRLGQKGQTETKLFTPQEARKALGRKFDRIADIIYFEGRESSDVEVSPVPEKVGAQDIQKILDQKNIASAIDSKEFNEMARAFVGKTGIKRMTNGERKLLAQRLAVLPSFSSPTILPDFGPKIYTADQLALATEHVQNTGDISEAGILSAAAIDPTSPRSEQKSFAILNELRDQGVIVNGKVPEFESSDQVRKELEEGDRLERKFRAKERPMEDPARLLPSPEKADQDLPLTSKQMDRLRSTLSNHMNRYGLKEIGVNLDYALRNTVVDSNGNLMFGIRRVRKDDQSVVPIDEAGNFVAEEMAPEGAVAYYSPLINQVFLSIDRVDPSKKGIKQISNELVKTLDHESVHALRQLDLWTDKEWNSLELAARNTKREDGETYLKWAQSTYNQPGTSPILQMEEAIAEMTKDLKAGIRLGGKPRSSLERVGEFFERLVSFVRGTGYQSISDIMQNVEAGVIGGRERGVVRTLRLTEKGRGAVPDREILPVGDVAGDPEFTTQTRADFGNLYRRESGVPDLKIKPEIEEAFKQLQSGKITRDQYNSVVLGTISPYDFVPKPATKKEMVAALKLESQKKKVNLPVEDGSSVGLRLDIPAYTNHGVWVPTIHNSSGTAISHMSTASITGADFTLLRPRGVDKKTGQPAFKNLQEDALQIMKGERQKFPFAQIRGNYLQRTPQQNAAIARKALTSKDWTQVGFDPRRHSYFYDRTTGEPVTYAEEVVQVGPLVLAKNATKNVLPTGEAFDVLYSRKGNGQVSTRFPTAARATEDPLDDLLVNDYDTFINSKDVFKKNMELIKNAGVYPNLQKSKNLRTDEQKAEAFVEHVKDNLLYLYDSVPEETRDVSKLWYVGANKLAKNMAETHGITVQQASAVLANLSPQKDWYQNASLGERAADIYFNEKETPFTPEMKETAKEIFFRGSKKAQAANKKLLDLIGDMSISEIEAISNIEGYGSNQYSPKQIEEMKNLSDALTAVYIRAFDETYNDRGYKIISPNGEILDFAKNADGSNSKVGWGSLNEIAKSVAAMKDADIDAISLSLGTQNKVRNFYNNIFNPESDLGFVTIDTHAVAAGLLQPFSGKSEPVLHNFGGGAKGKRGASSSKINGLNGTYSLYEEGYRRAAAEREVLAREMQSITWEAVRGLFKPEYKSQASNTEFVDKIWKRYNKKQITLDQVRREILNHAANGEIERPDWERSDFRPDESVRPSTYKRKLLDDGVSRQDSLDGPDGRGRGYATGSIPRQVKERDTTPPPIPEKKLVEAVESNINQAFEPVLGHAPRINYRASAEAQVIAGKKDLPPIDPSLDIKFSRSKAPNYEPDFEAITGGLSSEPVPTKTPMDTYIEETELGPFGALMTNLKQKYVNKWARLEDLSHKYFTNELGDSSSIAAAMMLDRSKGFLGSSLKYGYPSYENGAVTVKEFVHNGKTYQGLLEVMAMLYPGGNAGNVSLEELAKRFAIMKRAKYLNENPDLKTPIERGQEGIIEEAIMKEVNKHINPETGKPVVLEWYDTWQAYNNKTIKFLKNTGMIDDAGAEAWSAAAVYFPFYKQSEGSGYVEGPNVFKGLTGTNNFRPVGKSEKPIDVPMLESITRNLSAAIDMGMQNIAQQRIVRDMTQLGTAREVKPGEREEGRNVITFKVDGVQRKFEIDDPLLFESMMAMGGQDLSEIVEFLSIPANVLRELVTREPGFQMGNMTRDTLSAWTTSGADFVPFISTLKNFSLDTKEMEMLGIVGGYDFKDDIGGDLENWIARESRKLGMEVGELNAVGKVFDKGPLKAFQKIWDVMGQATTASDAATRKAVFQDVLKRTGGNVAEAQFQGLEVLNFGRRGYDPLAKILTAWIPFLNARIQGLDVINRASRGRYSSNKSLEKGARLRQFILRGGTLAALSAMYYAMVSDEDEYESQEEYIKDNHWIIPTSYIKKAFGVDISEPIQIPIPFEIGLIFKTLPERIARSYDGKDTGRESLESFGRALSSTLEVQPPQFILPLLETTVNHNLYTGRGIVPYYMSENLLPALQKRSTTSDTAVAIGEALNMSPLKIEHLMKGYTGTIGSYVLMLADSMVRDSDETRPTRKLSDLPIMKRFLAKQSGSVNQTKIYELEKEIKKVVSSLNELEEREEIETYQKLLYAKSGLVAIEKDVRYITKRLKKIRDQRSIVLQSNMSADLKQEYMDQFKKEIDYLTASAPILEKIANRSPTDIFNYP